MGLYLADITKANWEACIALSVSDEQQPFIASNLYSLAQSKFEPEMRPLGIYVDDQMVGFLMYVKDSKADKVWLVRLMIDRSSQGKGYGKTALSQFIELMNATYKESDIFLCVEPENQRAVGMYEHFGFLSTGKVWDEQKIYRRPR